MQPIPLDIVVEDSLSESVLTKLLRHSEKPYSVGDCLQRGGFGYIKRNISGFNRAAQGRPFFILTDLDRNECAPNLIEDWLHKPISPNLVFRVAVREVEAWLLADRDGISEFLGVRRQSIPLDIEDIGDPKSLIVSLSRSSRRRSIRLDIAPAVGSTARQGPDYNARLQSFVQEVWDLDAACTRSDSLSRAVERIRTFEPSWSNT